jgi:hypothetical protein
MLYPVFHWHDSFFAFYLSEKMAAAATNNGQRKDILCSGLQLSYFVVPSGLAARHRRMCLIRSKELQTRVVYPAIAMGTITLPGRMINIIA